MANFDQVTLEVKVLEVNPPCTVPTKQDLTIADSTGTIKTHILGSKYKANSSYEFARAHVHPYLQQMQISQFSQRRWQF